MLQSNPEISSVELIQRIESISGGLSVIIRHINRIRLSWGLVGKRGRPIGTKKVPRDSKRNRSIGANKTKG